MKLLHRPLFTLTLLAAVAGCASDEERRQAEGGFDYLELRTSKPLVVPPGLTPVAVGERYNIPVTKSRGGVGGAVSILPPPQLIPLAEGSSVVEGLDRYAVRFEITEGQGNLRDTTWYTLWEYFADAGLQGRFWDREQGVVITDWHTVDLSEKKSLWSRLNPFGDKARQELIRQRFLFTLDIASHGRSATLGASLLEFERELDGQRQSGLSPEERRVYVVGLLNEAVAWYEYKQRLIAADSGSQGQLITLGLGKDGSGVPIFVADANFNRTWASLTDALERLGFVIEDRDKTKGTFFVLYEGSASFWSSMFGADDELPLEREKFQVMVGELTNDRTSITILDDENRPLSDEVAAKVHPVLARELATSP
ncbi:MAG: outer membrane protein assembly factor BamC [Gammaproteobacteria bacterium]|nr:outer membrane protein assembly factor BamC [Gammaproteobacteria bacterium]